MTYNAFGFEGFRHGIYSSPKNSLTRAGFVYNAIMTKSQVPPELREYLAKLGKKGGKKGGPARAAAMTPEQRSESARKAVQARWAKAEKVSERAK